ncbi:MAG: L,D-transpeptidase family protein [Nitrospirota bacterium]|nr:L,D-transpeptidase family protein [Nitrospirota bacterium]
MKKLLITLLILFAFAGPCLAEVYSADDRVIGISKTYTVSGTESLIEVARRFDLGFNEIAAANPALDPFAPGDGATAQIPVSWIVPAAAPKEGIVINLSEMRLYITFIADGSRLVATFPIGIGSEGTATPLGNFKVTDKVVSPTWYVPKSVKAEKPWLPAVVPPGPENPLGTHAISLTLDSIFIHGTNKPWGIGRRVSHGCIRLYPEDIVKLFELTTRGKPVHIVREPVKIALREERVYIEVHKDGMAKVDYIKTASDMLLRDGIIDRASTSKLYKAIAEKSGVPVDITN